MVAGCKRKTNVEALISHELTGKQVKRAIRAIPVEAIAPSIKASESEGDGLWCLVARKLEFVLASGQPVFTNWDDFVELAQFERWVSVRPERVHATQESAVAFVHAKLGAESGA